MKDFQVAIIGGGVVGSAIAWELSKYEINTIVFEKGSDVASGTSKANSGVIHSGINSPPRSLKAKFCVEGNNLIKNLSKELGFSVNYTGKYVIAKNENEINDLKKLKEIGHKNKVLGLQVIDGKEVEKKEPNISCRSALWVPTAGIMLPYQFTIALAENAAINSIKFSLETKVTDIKRKNEKFEIKTNKGNFISNIIINSSGVDCQKIVSMLEKPDFKVYPCRGEYLILDKNYKNLIKSMIYPVPVKEMGVLGVHITPTIEGNILLGPSAEFIDNYNDKQNTKQMMNILLKEAKEILPKIPKNGIIAAYSGIRCKIASPKSGGWADFRIEESKNVPGLFNLIGIESPGLTAAPAIAKEIVKMINKKINMKRKSKFKVKKVCSRFSELSEKKQKELIKNDSSWGRIVCRCEHITEKEIINALSNPLGARTLAAVKYRCRAGMGRCQGGFCTQHIVSIMKEHYKMKNSDIKLKSPESYLFSGKTREVQDG